MQEQSENRIGQKSKKQKVFPYLFVLPAFLLHFIVVTVPAVSSLRMSLYDWNMIGFKEYIGFANYAKIFSKGSGVGAAIIHNLKWMAVFMVVPIVLGVVVAVMLTHIKRGQMFFRTALFMPYVISAAVAGRIWMALMNPYYGINSIFKSWGWTNLAAMKWLGNPKIALYSVAFVDNWHFWGFVMVLFLSALQQVDPTLYEAARIDGANRFQEFLHISIPGIRQTIAFMFLMIIMWSFLTFDYVNVMTQGGPAGSTEIMSTLIYKEAFSKYHAGYASALCVIQCILCVGVYFLNQYIRKKGGLEESYD